LSIAIVLILVDYILAVSVDSLIPWITEKAAQMLQNSKLGVNERLDEISRLVRAEYYRIVNPTQPPQRNKSKGSRNQPPRAPSPPRFAKGRTDAAYRHRPRSDSTSSSRSTSWQETSASSYDDFRGRQARARNGGVGGGFSATSSSVSASDFEEVPELSYESSEDDAYYYYDETASATSTAGFDTLGARVDDRWSCDSWHEMNKRDRNRSAPYDRHVDNQRGNNYQGRQPAPARGREREMGRDQQQREFTPPPRFSQTHFFDARNVAGQKHAPGPRTPRTPGGFHYPPPPPPHPSKAFAPQYARPPPPPPPQQQPQHFAPGPPQRRFSQPYVPMPDAPPPRNVHFLNRDGRQVSFNGNNGNMNGPRYPAPPPMQRQNSRPVTMVPGMQIPMPTSFAAPPNPGMQVPPPTPGFVHPRRAPAGVVPGLPRSQTWPPQSGANRRQTFNAFGVI
jgi:hypothetical protein